MPTCPLFFRAPFTARAHDRDHNGCNGTDEFNEKHTRKLRSCSSFLLAALRVLQLLYFVFAYSALFGFQKSGYFRHNGPWQNSPDQRHRSLHSICWARIQVFIALAYHAAILIVPWLFRVLKSSRRPLTGLATVFGDGCAMVAMLNVIVLLDGSHEGYCHGITNSINLQGDDKIVVGWGRHHVHMDKRRVVCASLDLVFGFGALVIFTYIPSVLITTWRSRHNQPRGFSKFQEQDEDVEQGLSIPHLGTTGPAQVVAAEPRRPATPQSPPPSYHSAVLELDEEYPDLNSHAPGTTAPARRSSMETVSSLGVERYLVSDGWRAPENPPEYSSRPPSLHYAVP